jgi:hypothetical protein
VPELHGRAAGQPDGTGCVPVIEGSREGDDADLRACEARLGGDGDASPIRGSSVISGLDDLDVDDVLDHGVGQQGLCGIAGLGQDVLGHLAVNGQFETLALAYRAKLVKPRRGSAPTMAFPCGSRISGLGMTSTTIRGIR